MVKVEWSINGRKVGMDGVRAALEQAVMDTAEKHIRTRLADMCCAEHGEGPRTATATRTRDGFSVRVQGCCENLIAQAMAALK